MKYILNEKNYKHSRQKPIEYIINNGCWECISHSNKKNMGYKEITRGNIRQYMHRYIYKIYYGEIPEEMIIRHKCDNPKCINPEHLEIGTHQDNMDDVKIRGISSKAAIKRKKLDNEKLLIIKNMLINNKSIKEISKSFSISESLILRIKYGNSSYSKDLNGGLKEWLVEE